MKFFKYILHRCITIMFNINKKISLTEENYLFVNTGQIGDLVVSSIILENDNLFIGKKCFFLIDSSYKELFKNYKGTTDLIYINLKKYKYNLTYRYKVLKLLRSFNILSAFNITAARGFVNDELTLLSGAKNTYTTCSNHFYLGNYYGRKMDRKYDKILFKSEKNEYEKNVRIISSITYKDLNVIKINNYKTFKISFEFENKNNYICISPFCSDISKSWDFDNYKYLIDCLSIENKIVLLGNKKQYSQLLKLQGNKNVEIPCLGLDELPEFINNSSLFIGNDSGMTHIAYRLNKPIVALISQQNYGYFFPYKKLNNKTNFLCFNSKNYNLSYALMGKPCMNISKESVLASIKDILENKISGKIDY